MNTIDRLAEIFKTVFEDDEICIKESTSAKDIEDWDSLMHVSLVLAIENDFKIRFSSSEVATLQNVGQLIGLIESKL